MATSASTHRLGCVSPRSGQGALKSSDLAKCEQVHQAPARNRQKTGQASVDWKQGTRMAPDQAREDRDGWEDAALTGEVKPRTLSERDVFDDRPIARMFLLCRCPNESALQQEVHARLQMRNIRD